MTTQGMRVLLMAIFIVAWKVWAATTGVTMCCLTMWDEVVAMLMGFVSAGNSENVLIDALA